MKKIILLTIVLNMIFSSCAQDDESHSGGNLDIEGTANIYPEPPAQWMGETDSYHTEGWVGDVMPFFDNGKFHLFFLHDAKNKPAGEGFHDIHMYETANLTDFDYKGRMIDYGKSSEADFAVGTGSVVKQGNTYYYYYTGHNGTGAFVQNNPRESVLCATSTDLSNWTKVPGLKITAPAGYYDYEFRDPHVFYNEEDNKYWMVVSTQTEPQRTATLLVFKSDDPASNVWTPSAPIYTTTPSEDYLMLECADIFKMGNYWYIMFSENWSAAKGTHYRMATSLNGPWTTPENDMLDGEFFYAAKTASDGNNRYLFGWTARRAPESDTGNKEFGGNLVTHQLIQMADGTLGVKVPDNLSGHFTQNTTAGIESMLGNVYENEGTLALDASISPSVALFPKLGKSNKIETQLSFSEEDGSAGFVFAADNMSSSYYKIVFEPTQNRIAAYRVSATSAVEVTRVPLDLVAGETYDVAIIADGSVCVVYVDGKVALSNRIYGMRSQKWGFISEAGSATFTTPEVTVPN